MWGLKQAVYGSYLIGQGYGGVEGMVQWPRRLPNIVLHKRVQVIQILNSAHERIRSDISHCSVYPVVIHF